ncbi:PhoP/PhoQ regulator MgrB [Providencia sp. Me31A]|uniref:PhoP/PhoQ regulator MgrB n=1 Tax=Providencia sp. Me31A TaxID=3392637 RepID=UPI003D266D56
MFSRKLIIVINIILSGIFLYILAMDSLAMDSFCDQGGENLVFGVCHVTDLLPF